MEKLQLRPPTPLFERAKLPLILLAYIAISEWADPFPFYASLPAKLAVFALVLLVVREFHHARLEVDEGWVQRTARAEASLRSRLSRVDRRTWLRLQRVVTWALVVYVFGMFVNSLTDRCDSAPQCAVLAPRMAAENLPMFIQFSIMIMLTLFQLALMFYAMVKVGPQPIDEPVLTPTGWRAIGELKVGDLVIGVDGLPKRVLAVTDFPGEKGVYVIRFSDGAETRATGNHQWEVQRVYNRNRTSYSFGRTSLVKTQDLRTSSNRRDSVPLPSPVDFPEVDLPIPPYTMGALLGDGTFRIGTPKISVCDPEILDEIENEGVKIQRYAQRLNNGSTQPVYGASLSPGRTGGKENPVTASLRELGLWDVHGHDKFIPDEYLLASVDQRRALLAGLLDTDGSAPKGTSRNSWAAKFASMSEELACGVQFLVRSLGGVAHLAEESNGAWSVRLWLPDNPFRLERKRRRWTPPVHALSRRVVSVEPSGKSKVRCITIDDPRGLYITRDCIVTHNSYKIIYPGTVGVSFDDVWGQDEAKQAVMEQVQLLEDSEAVERAGGYMPRGVLLYGPPGTGKTYLAKAAAGHSSKPLILVPPGAFQATFVGVDLLKVWTLFRTVRKLARRYSGVIVFLDEIDSLGTRGKLDREEWRRERAARRSAPIFVTPTGCTPSLIRREESEPRRMVMGDFKTGALQAFLAAMDGMDEPRGLLNRILVFLGFRPLRSPEYKAFFIGATNMKERMDEALIREGRFGRVIHLRYPKVEGRKRTYEGYLAKVKHELTPAEIDWAARNHARASGADVKRIVNEALLVSFRDGDHAGKVHFEDLMKSMVWVSFGESDGPFEREAARWSVAVHEAGHAVAYHLLLPHRTRIWFASIEQRGQAGGMVAPTDLHEDWLKTREEMLAEIQVDLASRVAEELILGTTTNGNGGDAQQATDGARAMVALGQAKQIGVYDPDEDEVREQTEAVLREALDACRRLLEPHKGDVEKVARLLYARGTVPGDEIHAMLGGKV